MEAILNFDWSVFTFVEEHIWHSWLTPIMVFFTHLGDAGILWILLSVLFLCMKKYRPVGIAMVCALLVMEVGNNLLLKEIIARPRPFNLEQWQGLFHFPEMISRPSSWSFPSGHTSAGFAAATALAISSKKAKFYIPSFIVAAIIGFTRIYVHVHYCTDVLGGIVVGILYGVIGYFVAIAVQKIFVKIKEKRAA